MKLRRLKHAWRRRPRMSLSEIVATVIRKRMPRLIANVTMNNALFARLGNR